MITDWRLLTRKAAMPRPEQQEAEQETGAGIIVQRLETTGAIEDQPCFATDRQRRLLAGL